MNRSDSEDLKAFYNELESAWNEEWDKTVIRVMVFGPNTDGDDPGAQLRKYIIDQCSTCHTVVKSEHEKLIEIHKKITGSTHNLCDMEYKTALQVDGIIILPYSPGSLVELGMFALEMDIHEKIFVLLSDEYDSTIEKSFIGLGPKAAYDRSSARVEVIDYGMKELAWEKISDFLLTRKSVKSIMYWTSKK